MAIQKFIPGPKKIIDHRGNSSGFYEAVCDVCGTPYYPKRSNSKYCNSKCAVVAHRIAVANGDKPKEFKKGAEVPISPERRVIQLRMALKKAEKDHDDYIDTCRAGDNLAEEIKNIELLEKKIQIAQENLANFKALGS